jgi:hypothetical protein
MIIHVEIMDDNGEVLFEHRADASTPSRWNAPTGQRLMSKMPQQSDNQNTGTYELFGITFQPHVRVDRPNGYTAPVPGPSMSPNLPMGFKSPFNSTPWGQMPPTPNNANVPQSPQGPSGLMRGN